jgi:hypothetical protein
VTSTSRPGRVAIRRSAVLVKHHGEGETIEIGPPKNGRSRVVDLDARTVTVLKAHRGTLAGLDLRLARDDGFVLPAMDGGVRHPERFSRSFAARTASARKTLGEDALPAIRLHDYADVRVMPMFPGTPWSPGVGAHGRFKIDKMG